MVTFTVLIPTFNNCESLLYSIKSVLAQDFTDFELFIVGDGCPEKSKQIIADFQRQDSRVRFFDNPKGPRHGEVHRHAALQEASGRYVTYLSDDDLFLPHHLSSVLPALEEGVQFLHTLPVHVVPTQGCAVPDAAIRIPEVKDCWIRLLLDTIDCAPSFEKLLSGKNFISLSGVAHSLKIYRELPHGWRTTPEGTYTDMFMWQQFLASPDLKVRAVYVPTYVHLAKVQRKEWTPEARVAELAHWSELVATADIAAVFSRAALEISQRELQNRIVQIRTLHGRNDRLKKEATEADTRSALLSETITTLSHRLSSLQSDHQTLQSSLEEHKSLADQQAQELTAAHDTISLLKENLARKEALLKKALETLRAIQESRVWRAANRLRENAIFSRVSRSIANYRSR